MSVLMPMDVERLFDAQPELFAYQLPSLSERRSIAPGDLVKLFFSFKEFRHPKPIWMTVLSGTRDRPFTGVLADMEYGRTIKAHFTKPIESNASHLYRVPLTRPEIENTDFKSETRS